MALPWGAAMWDVGMARRYAEELLRNYRAEYSFYGCSLYREDAVNREYDSVCYLFLVVAMTILTKDEEKRGALPVVLAGPMHMVAKSREAARDEFIQTQGSEWDLDKTEVVARPFGE
jgi:hypothetical protein